MTTTRAEPLTDDASERIRLILVTAGRHSIAEALGTVRSIEALGAEMRPVVLVTDPIAEIFGGHDLLAMTDVLPDGYATLDVLDDEDLLAFAEPFALELLVERHDRVAVVAAGAMVMGPLKALEEALGNQPLVLTAPVVSPPSDTAVPHLTLRNPGEPLSGIVVGASRESVADLQFWQQTMVESLFDPDMVLPSSHREGVLATLMGGPSVTVEGSGTVVKWADWAAMISRGVSTDGIPPVVDAVELWELSIPDERVDGEMTETEQRLVELRIHDAGPLQPFLTTMTAVNREIGDAAVATPYERLTRAIRRASDPTGVLWPSRSAAEFEGWLYGTNPRGVTRIADLYWFATPEMRRRFPEARVDPSGYLEWCRKYAPETLGFDLLDSQVVPVVPQSGDGSEDPTGLKNAVSWRWNIIKGIIPGATGARARGLDGFDAVAGPESGRGVERPKSLTVERAPSLWGSPPRRLSLVGSFRAESGLGQASRASLRALQKIDIPFSYIDISEKYPSRSSAHADLGSSPFGAIGDVNLLHANADDIITMSETVLRHRLGGRFNAAMWFWEAGHLPAWKMPAFDRIDELWVASDYIVDVLGQFGRVPVHNIGLAAPLPVDRTVDRERLGIREDDFVFLFVYDAFSSYGRKNPELALRAFIEAFGPNFDGVQIVLKASNLNKLHVDRQRVMEFAGTTEAITVIDRYLNHEDVYDLMAAADVYVSLHAAEGYGLTILEAMSLGTPAICTGYSGNMDFTTPENSWLVDYELMRTEQLAGPYPIGSVWAKPELESAVAVMRHVVAHPEDVAVKAEQARSDARESASLERYAANLDAQLRRVL